jgi:hypothetical protein
MLAVNHAIGDWLVQLEGVNTASDPIMYDVLTMAIRAVWCVLLPTMLLLICCLASLLN